MHPRQLRAVIGTGMRIDLRNPDPYNVHYGRASLTFKLQEEEEPLMKQKVLLGFGAAAGLFLFSLLNSTVFDHTEYGRFCRDTGLAGPSSAYAGEQDKGPYGGPGGGTYGERQRVGTRDDAKRVLKEYFSKKDVTVGEVREKQYYYEADILDKSGRLVDKVIVDKRTGRIRSIY
jgi:hypothetical protein